MEGVRATRNPEGGGAGGEYAGGGLWCHKDRSLSLCLLSSPCGTFESDDTSGVCSKAS